MEGGYRKEREEEHQVVEGGYRKEREEEHQAVKGGYMRKEREEAGNEGRSRKKNWVRAMRGGPGGGMG